MSELRLIEIIIPHSKMEELKAIMEEYQDILHNDWEEPIEGERHKVKLIVSQPIEQILDTFEKRFQSVEAFSMMIYPLEAVIPRVKEESGSQDTQNDSSSTSFRISREELYLDVQQAGSANTTFYVMTALSTIVAAIGILQNNIAVIIGSMVIAPLLGPNIALSLATTLADSKLSRKAIWANITGFIISVGISVCIGLFYNVDPSITTIALQTDIGVAHILLALAAGTAGTLAFTSGYAPSVIGVMVAVALLPPAVVVGLLLGDGQYAMAFSAFLILVTNIIGINLSSVVTFLWQGVQPLTWWEERKAKRATRISLFIWCLLLLILILVVLWAYQY